MSKAKSEEKRIRGSMYRKALFAIAALAAMGVLVYSVCTAWYSNVAETNGMVFETESWGFDGQIQVEETGTALAPGTSAYANLQISNNSEQINTLSVGVDKSTMSEALQKRIYFYVPAQKESNGELQSRIYLSPYTAYSYQVMPKSTLLLTQEHTSGEPVCYEWVYDMEGYYVYGTLQDGTLSGAAADESPVYLRPVTYDFTKATFSDSGKLLTVDGKTTVAAFLQKLSQTDGYQDDIGSEVGSTGYYPVSVTTNENGSQTGLWVYLCTKTEVEQATDLDTRIGNYAALKAAGSTIDSSYADIEALVYEVKLLVTSESLYTEDTVVSTPEQLTEALAAAAAAAAGTDETACLQVCLTSDLTLTSPLEVQGGVQVVLDLNGKNLTCSDSNAATPVLKAAPGSDVTVLDGTINGTGKTNAVYASGADVSLSEVTVKGRIRIEDSDSANTGNLVSTVRLSNCEVLADGTNQVGIQIYGNGIKNSQKTTLLVDHCNIESTYFGICTNGSESYDGTSIQVTASTVSGTWAGIYQPQRSGKLLVSENSTVQGFTGIAIKGGTATIRDSVVSGTAETGASGLVLHPTASQMSGSGFVDTGAGVYIEANYQWAEDIQVNIKDSTVSSKANDEAVLVAGPSADKVTLTQVNVK